MDDDRLKAMTFGYPEHIPVTLGVLPAAWMKYREKLDEVAKRHPLLFGEVKGERNYDYLWCSTYRQGKHTDGWGCIWDNIYEGHDAYVVHHPLPRRDDVRKLKAPTTDEGLPHGLMYMRLMYLRGFEEAMLDFAEEPPELHQLIDIVLEYNLGQLDKHLKTLKAPTMVGFGDDMGMQTSLPISPAKWRKYFKPCFSELFGRCRRAGHTVYLHSDGHIWEIIPDLIECGVNVINPQYRANGIENLSRVCKGKVCVDLDLDRQLFPFATAEQIDAHVREAVETLGAPQGGLWLKAETDDGLTLETFEAICCSLEKHRDYFRTTASGLSTTWGSRRHPQWTIASLERSFRSCRAWPSTHSDGSGGGRFGRPSTRRRGATAFMAAGPEPASPRSSAQGIPPSSRPVSPCRRRSRWRMHT